ncbi:hypothetical protein [Ralstonia sp.]|uniref:hypothetical protein n=1 Tax=Ralstonia sp. TaxID=54061 RepID=UPI002B8505D2|nr:hypothetical protein [Ralstonia sp.]HWV04316.1 hypothetical protein [Ralstonia sp.]
MQKKEINLYGPIADAFLLGGASVVALAFLRMVDLSVQQMSSLAAAMFFLANFVNHPHFAHSYQLFYGKAGLRAATDSDMYRAWWRCIAYGMPLFLFFALSVCAYLYAIGNSVWIAAAINVMGALVGWHYVKQGFGMVMLDAAFKRKFWSSKSRRAFLLNAYACWIVAWAFANNGETGSVFWGIFKIKFQLPFELLLAVCFLLVFTTIQSSIYLWLEMKKWREGGARWKELPVNGVLAYLISLYLWTLFVLLDPFFLLVVPFFHSLQYMAVIYRVKINEAQSVQGSNAKRSIAKFFVVGVISGGAAFWMVPGVIDFLVVGHAPNSGGGVFLATACMWLFINVHHYFIDAFLWRKENNYTRENLYMKVGK